MSDNSVKPPLEPVNVAIFVGLPLAALLLVPAWGIYHGYDSFQWLWALAFLYLNGLSITGGYHRLWAHKAYQAHPALRWFFAFWGAGALQNSILIWASDHRRHHRHVDDNERDPYSAGRGLWFSHMGWMLREYRTNECDFSNAKDLERDPVVMWQHQHYVLLTLLMNLGLPLLLGVWHGDIIGTVLLVGLLRLVVNHHVTFFINSLAHYWGRQPFSDQNTAKDNGFIALFTHGEGYHNFHHHFQTDYRNGIRWFDYDPTKWLIKVCSWVGLARDLKKVPKFKIREAQVAMQLRRAEAQIEQTADADKWRALLEQEVEAFRKSLEEWKAIRQATFEETKERLAATRRDIALSANEHVQALEQALKAQLQRLNTLQLQLQMAG
jgi:stearoyl-CoA desaturase (delta-9 desaturase)